MSMREAIGLNFVRPDAGRPGNYTFREQGEFLAEQYGKMGLVWNRMAFSWVLIEPEEGVFDFSVYDRNVRACLARGQRLLATFGGHFDAPPVPAWAGTSLKDVIDRKPALFARFVRAVVTHYRDVIDHWEVLNEPKTFHAGLTVADYVEGILRPAYAAIKELQPESTVLPCAYSHLPVLGDNAYFWAHALDCCDVHNLHVYVHWGYIRRTDDPTPELDYVQNFARLLAEHGQLEKGFWITETGWFGTCGPAHNFYSFYRRYGDIDLPGALTGREIVEHPAVAAEGKKCAAWLLRTYPALLEIEGCRKVFHWTSMDEFQDGYDPDARYGRGEGVRSMDMWGVIAGDGSWRDPAFAIRTLCTEKGE